MKKYKKIIICFVVFLMVSVSSLTVPREKAHAIAPLVAVVGGALLEVGAERALDAVITRTGRMPNASYTGVTPNEYGYVDPSTLSDSQLNNFLFGDGSSSNTGGYNGYSRGIASRLDDDTRQAFQTAYENATPNPNKPGYGRMMLDGVLWGAISAVTENVFENLINPMEYNDRFDHPSVPSYSELVTGETVRVEAPNGKEFLGYKMDSYYSASQSFFRVTNSHDGTAKSVSTYANTYQQPYYIDYVSLLKNSDGTVRVGVAFYYNNSAGTVGGVHYWTNSGTVYDDWKSKKTGHQIQPVTRTMPPDIAKPYPHIPTVPSGQPVIIEVPTKDNPKTRNAYLKELLSDVVEATTVKETDYPDTNTTTDDDDSSTRTGNTYITNNYYDNDTYYDDDTYNNYYGDDDDLPTTTAEREMNRWKELVTTKFPFSLPWDLMQVVRSVNASPVTPVIDVDKPFKIGSTTVPFRIEHDLSWTAPYMPFFRSMITIGFIIFLIMSTARLFGGAK